MTVECAHEGAEVVEETELCCACAEEKKEERESAWEKCVAWRRRRVG
jgi:hypothetical protein